MIKEEEFIEQYVTLAKKIGFDISATSDGCIYHAQDYYPECGRAYAILCNCDASDDVHWVMIFEDELREEVDKTLSKIFGADEKAKQKWLNESRIGLNKHHPVDLLETIEGTKEVLTTLRAEYDIHILTLPGFDTIDGTFQPIR